MLRQRLLKVTGGLVASVDVLGERLADDRVELGVDLGVLRVDARHLGLAHQLDGLIVALAEEQPLAGEQLVKDDADREDVGARIDLLARRGLWRQVAELALDDARIGRLELRARLGETEVHELDLSPSRDEHVRRRDVAMHDRERLAGLGIGKVVRILEALADLHDDVDGMRDRHALALLLHPLDERLQVAAVDVLHDDEVRRVGDADVEDADDVGVLQVHRQARLVEEHLDELLVLGEARQDALDRHRLADVSDGRFGDTTEHLRHASGVDLVGDAVFGLAGHCELAAKLSYFNALRNEGK